MIERYEVRRYHQKTGNAYFVTHICYFKDTALWCAALAKENVNTFSKIRVWDTENDCEVKEEYEPYKHYEGRIKKKKKKSMKRYKKSHPQKDEMFSTKWFTMIYDSIDRRWTF